MALRVPTRGGPPQEIENKALSFIVVTHHDATHKASCEAHNDTQFSGGAIDAGIRKGRTQYLDSDVYRLVVIMVVLIHVCVCVFFPFILDIKFVGRTSRGHTGERPHRISHPPSFCGACLNFSREKDSAIPFPRRP